MMCWYLGIEWCLPNQNLDHTYLYPRLILASIKMIGQMRCRPTMRIRINNIDYKRVANPSELRAPLTFCTS